MEFKVGDKVRVFKGFDCSYCRDKILIVAAMSGRTRSIYPITTMTKDGCKEVFKREALYKISASWRAKYGFTE